MKITFKISKIPKDFYNRIQILIRENNKMDINLKMQYKIFLRIILA